MLANREKNVLYEGQSLSLARYKGQLMLLSTSSGTLYRVQENAVNGQSFFSGRRCGRSASGGITACC